MEVRGTKMILKFNDDFFVQWDVIFALNDGLNLGIFNFWIQDTCYPGKGINITLNSIFYTLVSNIEVINNLKKDFGEKPINEIDFSSLDGDNFVWIDTGELFQFGFGLGLGFNNNMERIFYIKDFEESFQEINLPKGSFMRILEGIKSLDSDNA